MFISVTTVPAAGNIALGLAFASGHEIWGSAAQLGLNLTGMAIAGWATLAFQQAVWARMSDPSRSPPRTAPPTPTEQRSRSDRELSQEVAAMARDLLTVR